MADYKSRAHADAQAVGPLKLAGNQAAGSVGDRFQTFDEEHRDARNQFHDGSHLDAKAEDIGNLVDNLAPGLTRQAANADPDYDSKEQGLAEHTEFLFNPSASISSLFMPGILSSTQFTPIANGTNPAQKGCGIDMPSMPL